MMNELQTSGGNPDVAWTLYSNRAKREICPLLCAFEKKTEVNGQIGQKRLEYTGIMLYYLSMPSLYLD